jgi:uncharacterized protein YbaR (Trm112 family)
VAAEPSPVLSPELLALLRCPLTLQPLRLASAEELARVSLEAGLMREDGAIIYPIRDGIPILLPEAGLAAGA